MAKGYYQERNLELQTRISYGSRTDGQAVYEGYAGPTATEDQYVWIIRKNYYDSADDGANFVGAVFAHIPGTSIPSNEPCNSWTDLLADDVTFPEITGGY